MSITLDDLLNRYGGSRITRAQQTTAQSRYESATGIVLRAEYGETNGDLTLEWLPKWSLTHLSPSSRRGESFNLRIHRDGRWCLFEQPRHHPKDCAMCRHQPAMHEHVRMYPELVAPHSLGAHELGGYWKAILAASSKEPS